MKRILIDTDVILDFYFDRLPHSEKAFEIISLCETGEIEGYITPVILSNVYYLLKKTAENQYVIEKLSLLSTIIKVLPMDEQVAQDALAAAWPDFEDALQAHAAKNSGIIDVIVTRTTRDYDKSTVAVMSPETYLSARRV